MFSLLPNLIAACLVAGLAVSVSIRRPPAVLWPVLLIYQLFVLLYIAGDAITLVSANMFWEQAGIAILYTGSFGGAACCWILALRFAEAQGHRFEWALGRWIWLPVGLSAIGWLSAVTNPWHGQFVVPVIGAHNEHLWLWDLTVPLGYAAAWGSIGLYVSLAFRTPERDVRRNSLIMAGGVLLTLGVNFVSYHPAVELPFDITVLGLGSTSALFLFGAYRTRLFGLLPVALRQVVEHSAVGIVLVDPNGRWLYSNSAAKEMVGLHGDESRRDVFGQLCLCLRDPQGRRLERTEFTSVLLLAPEPFVLESVANAQRQLGPLLASGERWLHITSTVIPNRRGTPVAYALRLNDVTALREATARLQAEEERSRMESRREETRRLESLGVLAAGIAHDFNNLLAVILGNTQLAEQEIDSPSDLRHRLERIRSAGSFAVDLTDQILTAAGKRSVQFEPVDLSIVSEDLLDLLRATVSARCQIDAEFDDTLSPILGDATQLRQIIMNLVCNASEAFGESGGRIALRTYRVHLERADIEVLRRADALEPGDYVAVEVEDDGPGMSEDLKERIFEPFFTTRNQGRGLGLATVYGIAQSHGGAVEVVSRLGDGTRVRVLFPQTQLPSRARSLRRITLPIDPLRRTVLVVDDDDDVLEIATAYLERAGMAVIPAHDGRGALQVFDERRDEIDAVVLDMSMPEMDGQQTYQELIRRKPELGVVLVSGYGRDVAVERFGTVLDERSFLAKPYEPHDLVAEVAKVLPQRGDA